MKTIYGYDDGFDFNDLTEEERRKNEEWGDNQKPHDDRLPNDVTYIYVQDQ